MDPINLVTLLPQTYKEPDAARPIVAAGMSFLRSYSHLAALALEAKRPLFKLAPKIHYLHHIILEIEKARTQGYAALNPMSYSCSSAEDFIGRVSLLGRRVAAVSANRRTLQRWLAGAMGQWARS